MPRFPTALALIAVMVGCNQRSCHRLPLPKHANRAGDRGSPAAPLRLSLAPTLGDIRGHRWSKDDRWLAVWSEHTFVVFDALGEREPFIDEVESSTSFGNVEFSPDGRWFGVVSQARGVERASATLRIFSVDRRVVMRTFSGLSIWRWQFTRDSRAVAWLEPESKDAGLRFRLEPLGEGDAHRQSETLEPQLQPTIGLFESTASGRLFVAGSGDYVWFVDVNAARVRRFDASSSIGMASDGDWVSWANVKGTYIWNPDKEEPLKLSDARCVFNIPGQFTGTQYAFSNDQRTVATSGSKGACLWDMNTGKLKTVLRQPDPSQFIRSPEAWFNSDRGLVVDSTLWDVEHQRCLGVFAEVSVQGEHVFGVKVPDEPDKLVRLQSLDSQLELHEVASVAGRDCSLDLTGNQPALLSAKDGVVIACDTKPILVNLKTNDVSRLSIAGDGELTTSPHGRYLTSVGKEHVTMLDLTRPREGRQLVQRTNRLVSGFDAGRLWVSNSPEWQKFNWASLEFSKKGSPQLAQGSVGQPCGKRDMYSVGSHFIWSNMTEDGHGLVLCDMTSGRELGSLALEGSHFVAAVNADGTLAIVTARKTGTSRFWFVGEQRTADIHVELLEVQFAGPHTIVGQSKGTIVTVDAVTGATGGRWAAPMNGDILAADIATERVLVAGDGATLHNIVSGEVVARWPTRDLRSAAFGPSGLFVASDEKGFWVWQLPSTEPIGELFVDSTGYLFMHSNGKFETTMPATSLRALLKCNSGQQELAVERCLVALREPGLTARVLAQAAK